MILPSMTHLEISKSLFQDQPRLNLRADQLRPAVIKRFTKERLFPAYYYDEYTHQESQNKHLIIFSALTAQQAKNPTLQYLTFMEQDNQRVVIQWGCWPYRKKESSSWIAVPSLGYYGPHFFNRYRERVLKDQSMSFLDLISTYFSRNPINSPLEMSKDINYRYEKYGKYAMAYQQSDGVAFCQGWCEGHEDTVGNRDSDFVAVVNYNTFVTNSILSSSQNAAIIKGEEEYAIRFFDELFKDAANKTAFDANSSI